MVERRHVGPRDRVVALRAICRAERRSSRGVNRVVSLLPGGEVASRVPAVRRSDLQIVVVVYVALRTSHRRVSVREREARDGVIERSGRPRRGVMALRAICGRERRSGARVRRVVGLLPGGEVAAGVPAVCRGDLQMIVIVDVALLAGNICVPGGQRKIDRRSGVVACETRVQPAIKRLMAILATARRKICRVLGVRRIGRGLPIFQVTRLALRRQAVEDPRGCLLVAILALNGGVSAQ